ncbi:MAG: hypothetical protein PHW95_02715 [Patescibacteria group bacterium]|nr:hypothetical protein [Patescibacteria group bacterium]
MKLDRKKHYLQIAFNNTLEEAKKIIFALPNSDRIILEAGTPLIKHYGVGVIKELYDWWQEKTFLNLTSANKIHTTEAKKITLLDLLNKMAKTYTNQRNSLTFSPPQPNESKNIPYIVADLKCIDRGDTEASLAAQAGASAAVVMGSAPTETINHFITTCKDVGIDSMVDMMAIDSPVKVLRRLKYLPTAVILHRGVDETSDNKTKSLPINQIAKLKGSFNVMISIAGGDTAREIQSSIFNGADIVVVWKDFYNSDQPTAEIAKNFLANIR